MLVSMNRRVIFMIMYCHAQFFFSIFFFKIKNLGSGKMAQGLRATEEKWSYGNILK